MGGATGDEREQPRESARVLLRISNMLQEMVDSIFGGELQDLEQVTTSQFRKWFCTSSHSFRANGCWVSQEQGKVSHAVFVPRRCMCETFSGATAI